MMDGGLIRPGPDGLVWLSDFYRAMPYALGLTREFIRCDRTRHRFRVPDVAGVVWWPEYRRHAPPLWQEWGRFLESAEGARPAHWYVSVTAVKGEPDD